MKVFFFSSFLTFQRKEYYKGMQTVTISSIQKCFNEKDRIIISVSMSRFPKVHNRIPNPHICIRVCVCTALYKDLSSQSLHLRWVIQLENRVTYSVFFAGSVISGVPKTFQNINLSSPADATVQPLGL
eukprot:TRINITY_DN11849_c0_g1_i9.p1 TRINITY_DN11849_c0_g1~~TRINITY_DN11849_c0_g1_i9.p1  ORF type:complete len:128 (+),score=8.75 TRINITY_DN11849_c0_g1_i9:2-385(+)